MNDLATGSGLKPAVLEKIRKVFAAYPEINQVILYGSRAKGNYRRGSDIDLTIKSGQLTLLQLMRIEQELDDLLLPYKIDLSLFRTIENQDLIDHIERVGLIL